MSTVTNANQYKQVNRTPKPDIWHVNQAPLDLHLFSHESNKCMTHPVSMSQQLCDNHNGKNIASQKNKKLQNENLPNNSNTQLS